ncbi:putative checkpoint protein Rad17/Rad24 [Medicago truncatula]|uniref:Cell cycle checkpoint protein RAD17, putative n=2 Tax=Medicago truncatula TaxID=3880 RepID=G7LB75_MEDTR|nr:cell cycle checkpoint protein RAD17 [Medicago truncatula]AET03748.1 cell cycle checkpoint protein RAD17, putative [Medicago truncatula]RHN41948.1 putative checkpoint protein Rad17/Rad24 [Medicago truncatula]
MAKRNSVIVLSSDDEENAPKTRSLSSTSSKPKPKPKSTSTGSRGRKKARVSSSAPRLSKLYEINLFDDDFNQVFTGSKVFAAAGTQRSTAEELWVDKYKPHSLEELAVHKKKVEEVKTWFEERLKPSKGVYRNNVLVVSGQAGIGKSAAIHVIASHLGAMVCGWNTPTPVIWQEHLYNSGTETKYTSKLDEFVSFVERIRTFGLIPTSFTGESKPSIIYLIDDLPMMHSKAALGRLKDCLNLLVHTTRIPTAILVTDYGNTDSADYNARSVEELKTSLESSGACKIAFNPITVNSIKKILFRICQMEQCDVTADNVDLIAKASGGDIRHAITSLQFFCLNPNQVHSLSQSTRSPHALKEESNKPVELDDGSSLYFGRDETLSLFHALGKFLHNKRETGVAVEYDQNGFLIHERFSRLPLKMDVPEKILCQSHVQPGPVADFLHENVLDFLNDEAVEDAWILSSYLGDADILLTKLRGMVSSYNEAESILQSAAASIAVRGVLFGNSCPLSSRWHAIRRPKLWQVEKELSYQKNKMLRQRIPACNQLSSYHMSVMATEYMPMFKLLGNRVGSGYDELHQESNIDIDKMSLDGEAMEISDDDIEDW